MRVTITQPGVAIAGDPEHPDQVISFDSLRALNEQITAAGYPTAELAGAVRCPACLGAAALFATVTLVYRRGRQPVACTVALCDGHAQAEAARVTAYRWPHVLLDGPLPTRCRVYDLGSPDGQAAISEHLGAWPDVLALFTAGAAAVPAGQVTVPELAGAPS